MTGPVRKSPSELERMNDKTETGQVVATTDQASRPLTLVEKFAASMGGIEPEKMLTILKATAFRLPDKKYGGDWRPQEVTNEQMGALLVVAHTYGLNPFLKEIYAFPDKGGIVPIVGVDGWSRMINNHNQFDGMEFEFDKKIETYDRAKPSPAACTCIIYRKDRSHPTKVTEYLDEVYRKPFEKNSEFKDGPWQSHTKRMLRHKAMIQCARLAFGFTGIHDQDEAERIVEAEYIPASDTPTQAKSLTNRFTTDDDAAPVCDHIWVIHEFSKLGDTITCRRCPEIKIYEPAIEAEAEVVAEKPEPKPKPKPKPKATAKNSPKKQAPLKESTFLNDLLTAGSVDEVNEVLDKVAGAEGLSQAKRLVIKKAAKARVTDLQKPTE